MKKAILLAAFLCLPALAGAVSWVENDYSFGSNGFQRDSLTYFTGVSTRVATGANATFYKDGGSYRDKAWSFRIPVMYTADDFFLSASPFFYPSLHHSRALGGKLYLLVPVSESDDKSHLHLIFSGAAAQQETTLDLPAGPAKRSFTETIFELQAEKSYYNQFFFLATASGFMGSGPAKKSNLVNPVLDHGELASLGTFRPITGLPEWAMGLQLARSMAPDYDCNLYIGYTRIAFRGAETAGTLLGGMKLKLNEKSWFDFGYNFYKIKGEAAKSYFKLLVQVFFGAGVKGE